MRILNTHRRNSAAVLANRSLRTDFIAYDRGAAIPEYAIIIGVFIGVAVVMALTISPLSGKFHNDVTPGLDMSYPSNYIPPPTVAPTGGG